jgi:HEAT repeat protein
MGRSSLWGTTPQASIAAACARWGFVEVVAGCVELIEGRDADPALVTALGGPEAARFLDAPPEQRYWLRVWGARGLLWSLRTARSRTPERPAADDPAVTTAVLSALADKHWRVREMAAKVVARHRLDAAQPAVTTMLADGTPRVRIAAARALRLLAGDTAPGQPDQPEP